jgi:hypothetical protein
MPPAAIYDKNGRALLSWRVMLLPYLEDSQLHDEFKLDEPWDSPHNIGLLDKMPAVFADSRSDPATAPRGHTYFQVFVGKGTAFEGTEGVKYPDDLPDGPSHTILIIEGGKPVPWTKPEDIPFDPDKPLPDIRVKGRSWLNVAMADGAVITLDAKVSDATLRAAITRNGHDKLGRDWWE